MAPSPSETAWFVEETTTAGHTVDALIKRLKKLEAKWRQVKYSTYISSFVLF